MMLPMICQMVPGFFNFLNCRSIISHIDELRLIFKENLPYFIAVSETWLDASIVDSEISIPGYTVQRHDRGQNHRGGGVALFVLDFKIF